VDAVFGVGSVFATFVLGATMWSPSNVTMTQNAPATIATAIAGAREAKPDAQLIEKIHVTGNDGSFDALAHVRGADYRIDIVLDGAHYAFGRVGTSSWRRTPNGSVRVVAADVQSDPLDRWPRALFGFTADGCTMAGQTTIGGVQLWSLGCRAAGDIVHWYDIDPSGGRIVREVARDGAHVMTYDFSDASHWAVDGYGGHADVSITDVEAATVSADDVAIPASEQNHFLLPASGIAPAPTNFRVSQEIDVPVEINGRTIDFSLDTGTTQILIDIGEAARLGLHPRFGHVVIPELRVGQLVAHDIAAQAVDLFHGELAGLLGNEFFTGHIVHINYAKGIVEVIAHDRFTPPQDAQLVPIDCSEGMPLVEAMSGDIAGDRFALDTGSFWILLSSAYADRAHVARHGVNEHFDQFLEGSLDAELSRLPSLTWNRYNFTSPIGEIEIPRADNLDIPLDGILGTQVLSLFDLWFDYDNGKLWLRYLPT
jgi:hypothetical protein